MSKSLRHLLVRLMLTRATYTSPFGERVGVRGARRSIDPNPLTPPLSPSGRGSRPSLPLALSPTHRTRPHLHAHLLAPMPVHRADGGLGDQRVGGPRLRLGGELDQVLAVSDMAHA